MAVVTFKYNENEMMLAWMLDQISLSPYLYGGREEGGRNVTGFV